MTVVSSTVILKQYVLGRVNDILTADSSLSAITKYHEIGLTDLDLAQLSISQYPCWTVNPGGSDDETRETATAPGGTRITQRVTIGFGVIQPTGRDLLLGGVTAYTLEAFIKAALDADGDTYANRLSTTTTGVSPNPTWAYVTDFWWGGTRQIGYRPDTRQSLFECDLNVEYDEDRVATSRVRKIYWDDGT